MPLAGRGTGVGEDIIFPMGDICHSAKVGKNSKICFQNIKNCSVCTKNENSCANYTIVGRNFVEIAHCIFL